MADNRSKAQIKLEHDVHVERDRYTSWKLFNDVPMIDPDRGYLGSTSISVCDFCPQIEVTCNHEINDWNAKGTKLICRLCGMDVT